MGTLATHELNKPEAVATELAAGGTSSRSTVPGPRVRRRVLILCGDVAGNLGDHAILKAMCDTLRKAAPDVALRLVVTCSDRTLARRSFRATTLPPGWRGWLALSHRARRSNLVLCGGGGLFQDDDSLVKMPYWAARVIVARRACRRVAGVSLGVGPLKARLSRVAGRAALRRMNPVSTRDALAQSLASTLTGQPVALVPDPALLLKPRSESAALAVLGAHGVPLDGRPLIGVAVRRWFPPRARLVPYRWRWRLCGTSARERADNHRLASLLAASLDHVLERHGGHVVFLPSYNCPHEADDEMCRLVSEQMRHKDSSLIRITSPALYKAVLGKLAVMLGGRMHPTLLAAGMGTPIVGLAYNPKFQGLFDLLEQSHRTINVRDYVEQHATDCLAETVSQAITETVDGKRALAQRADTLARETRTFLHSLIGSMR